MYIIEIENPSGCYERETLTGKDLNSIAESFADDEFYIEPTISEIRDDNDNSVSQATLLKFENDLCESIKEIRESQKDEREHQRLEGMR